VGFSTHPFSLKGGERMRKPRHPAFTPIWDSKRKTWTIYNPAGTSIAGFKPLALDLTDILAAYLLATKAADKLADKHFKNMWAA